MKEATGWFSERMGREVRLVRWGHFGAPVLPQEQNRAQILLDSSVAHDQLLGDFFNNIRIE